MKVGFILYGSINNLSGGYLYDRSLVKYLRDKGDRVDVISLPLRNYSSHLLDNINFRLPLNYDILLQDELNHPSLIIANLQSRSFPVVSLIHHLRSSENNPAWLAGFYGYIERQYLRSVDGFIFNSKTTASSVSKLMKHNKPSLVAYPPTDRLGTSVSPEEIMVRSLESPLRLLFLGNLIPRKGLHVLLDALAAWFHPSQISSYRIHPKSVQGIPEITLDIVGSRQIQPAYARAMQKKVSRLGLENRIQFHEALEIQPLRDLLRNSHLLVLPSSYEGFGIAYLEGMGFGLPAIGTSMGAASEIITDGINGFLIEPENSQALLDNILQLATDRERLTRMSLAALQRFLEQPAWVDIAGNIRNFLIEMSPNAHT